MRFANRPTPSSLDANAVAGAALRRPAGSRVLLFVNRGAGSVRRRRGEVDEAARRLLDDGLRVDRVDDPAALRDAAAEFHRRGDLRCCVVAGGDGTFNFALNQTPSGTPLVCLPTGTENLLAGYLRHTRRAGDLSQVVRDGVVVPLDAGDAGGRLFGLMATVGFDAEVVRRVHLRRHAGGTTRNIHHLDYARPILESLGAYRHPRLRVTAWGPGGEPLRTVEGSWLFAINVPRYASGLRIAPGADGADGLLDLCVFGRGDAAAGLWYLWHVLRRRHHRLRSVETLRARGCRVESLGPTLGEPTAPFQVDGDFAGRAPVTLSAAPGRMAVLVSRERARRLLQLDRTPESQTACPPTTLTPTTTPIDGSSPG